MTKMQFANRCGWQLLALSCGIFIGIHHEPKLLSAVGPWLTALGALVVGFTAKTKKP